MNTTTINPSITAVASRRRFLQQLGLGSALFTVRGAFAEALARPTAWVEEGPFYPPKLPLDTDNDNLRGPRRGRGGPGGPPGGARRGPPPDGQ